MLFRYSSFDSSPVKPMNDIEMTLNRKNKCIAEGGRYKDLVCFIPYRFISISFIYISFYILFLSKSTMVLFCDSDACIDFSRQRTHVCEYKKTWISMSIKCLLTKSQRRYQKTQKKTHSMISGGIRNKTLISENCPFLHTACYVLIFVQRFRTLWIHNEYEVLNHWYVGEVLPVVFTHLNFYQWHWLPFDFIRVQVVKH